MSDGNKPRPIDCPHCGDAAAEVWPVIGDRVDLSCPQCGDFSISGTTGHLFAIGTSDPRRATFVDRDGRRWLQPGG